MGRSKARMFFTGFRTIKLGNDKNVVGFMLNMIKTTIMLQNNVSLDPVYIFLNVFIIFIIAG